MHTIDTKNFNIRTDLIIEKNDNSYNKKSYKYKDIIIDRLSRDNDIYISITFKDITDKDNYNNMFNVFKKELKSVIGSKYSNILIVGLGNDKSTPDSLGPLVVSNTLVTRYLFSIGDVSDNYACTSTLLPSVYGSTGIESIDLIRSCVEKVKPDLVILIDSLCASNLERVNKVIQITNTGINPGSGVLNDRGSINKEVLGVDTICIGVPTIVDLITVVSNTFKLLEKKISFTKYNKKCSNKLVNSNLIDYSKWDKKLSKEEKNNIMGLLGTLNENDIYSLLSDVLIPVNCNLMVTPKEIDYFISKVSMLIGTGINEVLHKTTK